MEYGRPNHIEKSHWVYRCDFFRISFFAIEKYQTSSLYHKHETNKTIVEKSSHNLKIEFGDFGIGLGDWEKRKSELISIAAKCKPLVKTKITNAITEADRRIAAFKIARKELLEIDL